MAVGYSPPSTDTLTKKTLDPTDNLMRYPSAYTYTIYQDGGAVKCRNNKTDAVTSNANLDPLITTILASGDPSFEIQPGTYALHSSFAGWDVVDHTYAYLHRGVFIIVPNAHSTYVWKLTPTSGILEGAIIQGGTYSEQGSAGYAWFLIEIAPVGTGVAVLNCSFQNMNVEKCYCMIHIKTTGQSWANSNEFRSIWGYGPRYGVLFEHVSTYAAGQSGPNGNIFEDVAMQALTPGGGNNVIGGFIDIFGQYNTFSHCSVWDIAKVSPGTPSMTIGSNSDGTIIQGGVLTHATFTDNGVDTIILDKWQGLYNKNVTNLKDTLNITIPASGGTESIFNFGVSDASGDSFTLENSTITSGVFGPLFRSTQSSSAVDQWNAGLWFQTLIKTGNDIAASIAANVISAHNTNGTVLSNRAILDIENKFTPCYTFFPTYVDFRNKEIQNAVMGNLYYKINPKTATYTTVENDIFVPCNASSGAFTVTLLRAASKAGKIYIFKKTATTSNVVTIDGASSETIEGLLAWELRQPGDRVKIISDGTNWNVIDSNKIEHMALRRTGTSAPNRYYIAGQINQTALGTSTAVTANRLYAMPFTLDRVQTIDSVGVNLTSQVAASNVIMGIYKDLNGVPGVLLADLGTVGTTNPPGLKEVGSLTQKLQPGNYWLTAVFSHSPIISHLAQASITPLFGIDDNAVLQTGMYGAHTYGALPSTYPTVVMTTAAVSPALFYHFSA